VERGLKVDVPGAWQDTNPDGGPLKRQDGTMVYSTGNFNGQEAAVQETSAKKHTRSEAWAAAALLLTFLL
jgi:hypothetical protein